MNSQMDRVHSFANLAQIIRRILVDATATGKYGGDEDRIELSALPYLSVCKHRDFVVLNDALDQL